MADLIETPAEDADDKAKAVSEAERKKLDKFLQAFDSAASPQQPIRAGALQARRFLSVPGGQWEGDWEDFSANMIRVEVNKTARGHEKITNDYRANRVEVDFRPVGDVDDETAETLDGLYRADAYRSRAGQAYDNAFDEGSAGGMGAWRLCNEHEDSADPDNDHQVINTKLIVDADQSVYFDPNSKEYDKSDAKWGCVISAVARQAFIDEWGDDRTTDWPKGVSHPLYDWFTPDVIRICEWYQVEELTQKRITLTNAVTGDEMKVWANDVTDEWLKEQTDGGWTRSSKSVTRKRVRKYVLSGAEILKDCGLIAGSEIPIILFYGKRWFIDNQEWFRGHVQLAMDPQRIYNSQVSRLVETASASPREVPIFYPEQVAGHEADWARANIDRLPFLRVNPMYTEEGQLIPSGQAGALKSPDLPQVTAALLQLTAADIAELTNSEDGADETKANVSHEAMDLAATRTDEKSSGYMDNFRLSMEWAGRVYLGMAKEIYVEEGRKVRTLGKEGEEGEATLLEPKSDKGQYLTINDFARGRFNVIADVTESSATKRDKTVRKALGVAQIAGANQSMDLANAALITAVANMDGDGMDDFKEYARKAGLQIGLFKPTDQEQQEAKDAAAQQGQQQPDPAQTALMAQGAKYAADADLAKAKAGAIGADVAATQAKTVLTLAQAHALGGPAAVPETPTGLEHATGLVDVAHKAADTELKTAQAEHLRHGMQEKSILRGHQIAMEHRQQDHAESANDKAAA